MSRDPISSDDDFIVDDDGADVAPSREPRADGIYDLGFGEYHAIQAWGSSALKAMRLGPPARVLWDRDHPTPDTDATILGTRAHCLILTPHLFDRTYVELPADAPDKPTAAMLAAAKPSPSSVERQAWWRAFDAVAAGRETVKAAHMAEVRAVRDAFVRKDVASDALAGASAIERSVLWTCETTGERLKGRPDFWQEPYVFDLKVTRDAGPRLGFAAYRNGWAHQLAHYRSGLRALGADIATGRIVAISPDEPHYVWCIEFRESDLDVLSIENERTVLAMAECAARGEWPDTADSFVKVDIPQWAIDEEAHALDLSGATEVAGE